MASSTSVRVRPPASPSSNHLAQRAGSAVTVGVAAYILSLPDGAPITIAALCAHFSDPEAAPKTPPAAAEARGPEPTTEPENPPPSEPVPAIAPPAPQAADLLAALPHRDRRLFLSEREITALAPAVTDWLDRGAAPQEITDALTIGLPAHINRRPARLLAHR
ncbi:hypothetical protein EST54_33515, partial [Streptomyces sioyaensis]